MYVQQIQWEAVHSAETRDMQHHSWSQVMNEWVQYQADIEAQVQQALKYICFSSGLIIPSRLICAGSRASQDLCLTALPGFSYMDVLFLDQKLRCTAGPPGGPTHHRRAAAPGALREITVPSSTAELLLLASSWAWLWWAQPWWQHNSASATGPLGDTSLLSGTALWRCLKLAPKLCVQHSVLATNPQSQAPDPFLSLSSHCTTLSRFLVVILTHLLWYAFPL